MKHARARRGNPPPPNPRTDRRARRERSVSRRAAEIACAEARQQFPGAVVTLYWSPRGTYAVAACTMRGGGFHPAGGGRLITLAWVALPPAVFPDAGRTSRLFEILAMVSRRDVAEVRINPNPPGWQPPASPRRIG